MVSCLVELDEHSHIRSLCFLFLFLGSVNVYVPKDRVTGLHLGYEFIEFRSEEDADYVSIYLFPSLEEF